MKHELGLFLGIFFGVFATFGGWWTVLHIFQVAPYPDIVWLQMIIVLSMLAALIGGGPWFLWDAIQGYRNEHRNRHPIHYGQVLELMEKKYQEKIPEYGDSWKDCDSDFFIKRLLDEIEEFEKVWTRKKQLPEAVDIANFATMLLAITLGYGHAWSEGHIPGRAFRSVGGPG